MLYPVSDNVPPIVLKGSTAIIAINLNNMISRNFKWVLVWTVFKSDVIKDYHWLLVDGRKFVIVIKVACQALYFVLKNVPNYPYFSS